jgi:hypothetical protein
MLDKFIYRFLDWVTNIKIKKDSHLRDSMFWYIVIISIVFFGSLFLGMAKAGEQELYSKIKTIEPKEVNGQYCYVKVVIKQKGDDIMKEEILECADGKKGIETPGYWELFAQFYYRDVSAPEYCRYYSRPNHVFKSFGKTCLKVNGEWEVQ